MKIQSVLPLLFLLALVACTPLPITPAWITPTLAPLPTPSPTPDLPPPVSTPVDRQIVVLLPEPPDSLNPLYSRSWSARATQGLFLAGLWHQDQRLDLLPELAAEIPSLNNGGISADGKTMTIRLRADLTWSDGYPLTADDVLFTYEMALAPGNHLPSRFPYDAAVETVVVLDPQTVQVVFSTPFAPWPTALFPFILPRHVLEPVFALDGTLDRAVWNRMPAVGSGPFCYAGQEDEELVLDANPLYWRGRPGIDRVRVRAVPDPVLRWAAVTEGQADLAPFLWPQVPFPLSAPDGVQLFFSPSGYVETLLFNLDPRSGHPALQDARVRTAIVQAIDRGVLCRSLQSGRAEPAASLLSGTVLESPAQDVSSASVDAAARQLDDAGWRDTDGDGIRDRAGTPLAFRFVVPAAGPERTAVVEMLAAVGIGTWQLSPASPEPWNDPNSWDLAQWAEQPAGYPDPDDPRWLCVEARPGGNNPAGVCDEELDRLLAAQAATADPGERAGLLFQIQQLAREEGWWVPLCRWEDQWAVAEQLVGPSPWRGAPFWNVYQWEFERAE
ncbi:MAG: peptide ABC transporter substrate-binding protein [Anaerolineae bacterium]|nr:peptide ABC transporter substrate-binding protein [Anaerolineae bacterium]